MMVFRAEGYQLRRELLIFGLLGCAVFGRNVRAQSDTHALQQCVKYSSAGDLLKATVSEGSFSVSIVRPSGQISELTGGAPVAITRPQVRSLIVPCQLAVSTSGGEAALAIATDSGLSLQLIDVARGTLTESVLAPKEFGIQFSIHPVGYSGDSDQLEVSQAHYLPSGEPEIATKLVSPDGTVTATHKAYGARYTEVFGSSFDFRDSLVWFLCPVYSARSDRQPPCTLKSASLSSSGSATPTIPPRPGDAHVVGNGQPSLGFPSSEDVVVLATDILWVYNLKTHSFRQMGLPETPQHIRWFESPGQPEFTVDGRFAAIPVYLFHAPLFEEGSISHGTKLLIIDMAQLKILRTIQPPDKKNVVDFGLSNGGKSLTLVASWGGNWQSFDIPLSSEMK
jgi:hypothetical protein